MFLMELRPTCILLKAFQLYFGFFIPLFPARQEFGKRVGGQLAVALEHLLPDCIALPFVDHVLFERLGHDIGAGAVLQVVQMNIGQYIPHVIAAQDAIVFFGQNNRGGFAGTYAFISPVRMLGQFQVQIPRVGAGGDLVEHDSLRIQQRIYLGFHEWNFSQLNVHLLGDANATGV